MTTPADQAAAERVVLAWKAGTLPEGDVKMLLDQAIEQARREEREACAQAMCERCRITPHLPAFECQEHGGRSPWRCHDSGVEGWGHYGCSAAAIRARAQESEG